MEKKTLKTELMENKNDTLQAIKDEYAREQGYDNWQKFYDINLNEDYIEQIATRYAEAQTKELMEAVKELREVARSKVISLKIKWMNAKGEDAPALKSEINRIEALLSKTSQT